MSSLGFFFNGLLALETSVGLYTVS